MQKHYLTIPFKEEELAKLKAGDTAYLTGYVYTARDAAHKRLCDLIKAGKKLPIDIKDQVIYFVGPAPAKPGKAIGPCGPTTSYRMDDYSPMLLDLGLKAMIGKGGRSKEVVDSMMKNKAVYFGAVGGAAALIAESVESSELVCYEDLGSEAIRKLKIKDFPCIVVNDIYGNDAYVDGQKKWRKI